MLEMKITITAPDLEAAINNLAGAIDGKHANPVAKAGAPAASASVAQPETPVVPVKPTPAPATQQIVPPATMQPTANPTTPVPGAPLSTAPAQTGIPVAPVAPAIPAGTPVPTSAPQYTLDMIATAGSALIDAGKMDQLMGLLGKFGVASLTEIAPESYGAVANELRALGAAI